MKLPMLALTILTAIIAAPAMAEDSGVTITIKDHRFVPDMVEIPAGTDVQFSSQIFELCSKQGIHFVSRQAKRGGGKFADRRFRSA